MRPIEWDEWMIATLTSMYPDNSITDIADELGISPNTVQAKAKQLGLQKSPDYNRKKYHYRYVKQYRNKGIKE